MAKFHSFSWLSSIPFVCVCKDIDIYLIFFIHSSVDGHLGCFHTLAIVNNAAMNNGVHVPFRISVLFFFFGYMPRRGIAGSYGSSILSFLRNGDSLLFSIVAVSIYVPTNSARGFPFLHILTNIFLNA